MFFNIYSAVLLTLMFIMNLTSFSIMICSIKNYLKNKAKREIDNQISGLKSDLDYYNNLIMTCNDADKIKEYTSKIVEIQNKIAKLEKK